MQETAEKAGMSTGWIKIHRAIVDWEWWDDRVMVFFWMHLLLKANWEDKRYHGRVIERGSFVTSYRELAKELHLSLGQIRTCIDRLKASHQIETKSTHLPTQSATQITICNYATYQDIDNTEQHSSQHSNNTVTTQFGNDTFSYLNKEDNNIKKEGDIKISPKKESQPDMPYDEILKLWNENAKRNIPKVRFLSQARKDKVRLRVKEMGGIEEAMKTLQECFKKIAESDFCNGSSSGKWTATFDWFFENEKNWMKVLEGNYDNRRPMSHIEQSIGIAQRAKNLIGLIYDTGDTRAANGFADTADEQ